MSEYGYVIKNNEGKYWVEELKMWSPIIYHATGYYVKECALETIHDYKLKNCNPVKVLFEEVEE